ncbi:MAG TPA: DegT/DnrJ/EryC1/StrS family aminotransferase [archaeon]|nr:DegT/DnrJ/EryC1/StrS family aminotransferase [archaeon]
MGEKLAINGGEKAVTLDRTEALRWPQFGDEDFEAVKRAMQMPDYSFYEEAYRFEDEFKNYSGSKYALAHNNGTSAIHSALFALGIGPGDEVITPSLTFWASTMQVLSCNAIPIFAEVGPETLNLDPRDIEKKITPRTKAIVAVHLCGLPCAMDEIMDLARRHGIKVIEDASHAHGAEYKGKKIGTIGDIGCFSLQATKLLPALEGGLLITDNREYYERASALAHYERLPGLPEDSKYRKFSHACFGFKYRIHPLAASIARVQLKYLDERNKLRNENHQYLDSGLGKIRGLETIKTPADVRRTYYCYRIKYKPEELGGLEREKFIAALQAEGVEVTTERYELLHLQPVFQELDLWGKGCPWNCPHVKRKVTYGPGDLPVTEELHRKLLALPVFPQAKRELLDQYIKAFKKVAGNVDELGKIKGARIEKKPDMDWEKMQMVKEQVNSGKE